MIPVFSEPNNAHDRRAVAVYRDSAVVGLVPRELSRIFWFFLKHDGKIESEIRLSPVSTS